MPYEVLGNDGQPLDAHLDIEDNDIVFHSRGGTIGTATIQNAAYGPALRLVLERLSTSGRSIEEAWVDTARTKSIPLADRVILNGPDLLRSPSEQFTLMSGNMRLVGRASGKGHGGSTTKRIRIRVSPGTHGELADIIGARWAAADSWQSPSSDGSRPPLPVPLKFLDNLVSIDQAILDWLGALEARARFVTSSRQWLPEEALMLRRSPSKRRPGTFDVELGVRASGEPWTVQLNAPSRAADGNGLTSVAVNEAGQRVLIRQGRLRPNPDSKGEIADEEFRELSGLTPAAVDDQSTPLPRSWYIVANLDSPSEDIRRQTADFVHACARARSASLGVTMPIPVSISLGADEKGGSFFKKAVEAKPEQEVRRIQGEVWLALRGQLDPAGVVMTKPKHDAGYEVDGVICTPTRNILLEIKTGTSAADVYEGVGQLILYRQLLALVDHTLVLLLPAKTGTALLAAVKACGIEVHHYKDNSSDTGIDISFPETFLALCGAGSVPPDNMPH